MFTKSLAGSGSSPVGQTRLDDKAPRIRERHRIHLLGTVDDTDLSICSLLLADSRRVRGPTAVSGYFSPNMHRLRAKTVWDRRVSDVLPLCIGHSQLEETSTVISSKHKSPKRGPSTP